MAHMIIVLYTYLILPTAPVEARTIPIFAGEETDSK